MFDLLVFAILVVVGGVLQEGDDTTHHSLGEFLVVVGFIWSIIMFIVIGLLGWSSVLAFLAAMFL